MREKYEGTVKIPASADVAREVINYIYTGEITISSENALDILAAADYLMLDGKQYKVY